MGHRHLRVPDCPVTHQGHSSAGAQRWLISTTLGFGLNSVLALLSNSQCDLCHGHLHRGRDSASSPARSRSQTGDLDDIWPAVDGLAMGHGPPGTLTCFPLNWWSVSKLLAGSPLATCCPTASALAPRPLPPGIFLLPLALASPANGAEVRGLPWTVLSQSPAWWEWRALGTRRGFSGAQNSRWEWYLVSGL